MISEASDKRKPSWADPSGWCDLSGHSENGIKSKVPDGYGLSAGTHLPGTSFALVSKCRQHHSLTSDLTTKSQRTNREGGAKQ